ncbi:PepSY domain-containing protein [Cellulosilyticum ruminicola]|uniref:PepSY domain-containing protein n=1 Tax=Cellulosilyticum ruminicola TaxID=425254 RepID=UPI0006D1F852|nr:PepSY domain-containing protein [Cellulosilyticum ruminicola]
MKVRNLVVVLACFGLTVSSIFAKGKVVGATIEQGIAIKKELRDKFVGDISNRGVSNVINNAVNNVSNAAGNKVAISMEQAKQIALQQVEGAVVTEIELDRFGTVYEIELRKGGIKYEVKISAITGAVIKVEIDD